MKKIIGLSFTFVLFSFFAVAQSTATTETVSDEVQKICTPSQECADRMGITLEECKKICDARNAQTAAASAEADVEGIAETPEATADDLILTVNNTEGTKKKCCASIEECAEKMGMTVEECKKKCDVTKCAVKTSTVSTDEDATEGRTEGLTKVLSASESSEVTDVKAAETTTKKACCAGKKACKKK